MSDRFFNSPDDVQTYTRLRTEIDGGRLVRYPTHSHFIFARLLLEARDVALSRAAKDYLTAFAGLMDQRAIRDFCRRPFKGAEGRFLAEVCDEQIGLNEEAMRAVCVVLTRREWGRWRTVLGDSLSPLYPMIEESLWYGTDQVVPGIGGGSGDQRPTDRDVAGGEPRPRER